MRLLIVESPAKAKTINKYLGEKDYIVLSSYGHVRAIPKKNHAVEVDNDTIKIHYEIIQSASKNIDKLTKASKCASEIYFATDPDREGEAISWHLLEILKQQKAIKKDTKLGRIVFHEITKTAVKAAISNPRDINMDLVHAQQARQALDYIVGFTLSPILWRRLPGSRSAGRVQSVALRIISERESEVESFEKQEYWKVYGIFSTKKLEKEEVEKHFRADLIKYNGNQLDKLSIKSLEDSKSIIESLLQYEYHISRTETKQITNNPKPPFTTSTLLQDAAYKLGFSAKKTSSIAQSLYEGIDINGKPTALITYMRTDSVYVSSEVAKKANELISKLYGDEFAPEKIRTYKNKIKNAQEAHEAIRPIDPSILPEEIKNDISIDLYKLYDLIWKRFIASQMKSAILENTTIEITNHKSGVDSKANNIFKASGSVILFLGYRKIYTDTINIHYKKKEDIDDNAQNDDKDTDIGNNIKQMLPKLSNTQELQLINIDKSQHYTKPQPRFNEASLIKKMEELGIGRPSTYPSIISILQDRKYVILKDKQFIPEPRGRIVNAFLVNFFGEYVEYEFTAQMEDILDSISRGEREYKNELMKFWIQFKNQASNIIALKTQTILQKVEDALTLYIYDGYKKSTSEREKLRVCPICQIGTLTLKNSKFGPFIGCNRYPECEYTKQLCHEKTLSTTNNESSDNKILESEWPRILGLDSSDGQEILLNKGPYGFYVMKKIRKFGDEDKIISKKKLQNTGSKIAKKNEVKIVGLPKTVNHNDITLDYAQDLLKLPKTIGTYPEDEVEIKIGIGRYGPYIQYGKEFLSIKKTNFMDITYQEAVEMIRQKLQVKSKLTEKKTH